MLFDCRPILSVNNMSDTLAFYRDVFGFKIGWRWCIVKKGFLEESEESDSVSTALVGRDKVQFILERQGSSRAGVWLHLDVEEADEVDAMYESWQRGGADIVEPPSLRPWGTYEMRVRDPNDHVFRVSAPPRRNI